MTGKNRRGQRTGVVAGRVLLALLLGAAVVPVSGASAAIAAGEAAAEAAAAKRQTILKGFKTSLQAMSRDPGNQALVAREAASIAAGARMLKGLFPPGSDRVKKTGALPAIWEQNDRFLALYDQLAAGAGRVIASSARGEEATKAALGEMGGTCKTCHQSFRKK